MHTLPVEIIERTSQCIHLVIVRTFRKGPSSVFWCLFNTKYEDFSLLFLINNLLAYKIDQKLLTTISFSDSSILKISSIFSAKSIAAKSPDNGNVSQLKGNTEFNLFSS